MISSNSCNKYTITLVHGFFSIYNHGCNLFPKSSNKDTTKGLDILYDHSFTAKVYIYLENLTQAISPFQNIIISNLIRDQTAHGTVLLFNYFHDSSIIYFTT